MKKKVNIRIPRLIAIAIVILGVYLFVTALAVRFPFGIQNVSMETWHAWRAYGYNISYITICIGVLILVIDALLNIIGPNRKVKKN